MSTYDSVPLSYFIDELMLLDGMEQNMAEDFIRKACIDFCTRSQVITRKTEVELIECVSDYLLDIDSCEQVISIQMICGYEVLKKAPCTQIISCRPTAWLVPPSGLYLHGTPSECGRRVEVVVATAPTQDCCTVDRVLYDRYREVIIDKALAMLYRVKQARWFDLNLSQLHERDYRLGVTRAGADRLLGARRGKIYMKGGIYG